MDPRNLSSRLPRRTRSPIQWWFKALDKRRIGPPGKARVALVAGIHTDATDLWIQVMAAGDPTRSVVLHVSHYTTIHDAVAALTEAWSDGPSDRTVIHLAPAA